MSTQPEVWDREIQKVNDAAQEASFQVYRNHQDSINRTRARTLAEKVLNLVREEYETYETADGKWDENLRRQLGAPRADNLRRQGIRERLPAAVSKFTQELHPEEAMSPEEALLVLRATETAILAVDGSGSAGSDDDRFQASDGQQPRAGRSALLTPPGRDSKGPSGLKRTREQSVSPKPGDQTSPAQEGNFGQSDTLRQLPAKASSSLLKKPRTDSTPSRRTARVNPLLPNQHPERDSRRS